MRTRAIRLLADKRWQFARAYYRVQVKKGIADDTKVASKLAADIRSTLSFVRKVLNCCGGTRHLGADRVAALEKKLGPVRVSHFEVKPSILGNPSIPQSPAPPPEPEEASVVEVLTAGETRVGVLLPPGVTPKEVIVTGGVIKVRW